MKAVKDNNRYGSTEVLGKSVGLRRGSADSQDALRQSYDSQGSQEIKQNPLSQTLEVAGVKHDAMARRSMQDFKNHKQMHHASGESLIADNLEPKMMQSLGDIKFKPKHKQASSISHLDSALDGDLVTVDAVRTAAESNVNRPGTRAKSALSFGTLGTGYTVPRVDHSYKVKHRFKMVN